MIFICRWLFLTIIHAVSKSRWPNKVTRPAAAIKSLRFALFKPLSGLLSIWPHRIPTWVLSKCVCFSIILFQGPATVSINFVHFPSKRGMRKTRKNHYSWCIFPANVDCPVSQSVAEASRNLSSLPFCPLCQGYTKQRHFHLFIINGNCFNLYQTSYPFCCSDISLTHTSLNDYGITI